MFQFILLIGIWSFITGLFYWLGKRSIANLSERKLTEIIASPIFNDTFRRKHNHRILHWSVVILFTIGLLGIIAGALPFTFLFQRLQLWLFNTENGVFIPHNSALLYVASLGIGFAIIVLLLIFLMKKASPVPFKKWNEFPTLETTLNRIKSIRNFGFALSIILQITFIYGMYDYIIIDENQIIRNAPERLREKMIPFNNIKKVNLSYKYGREKSDQSSTERKILHPKFWIYTETDSFNIWYPLSKISTNIFQNTAQKLHENNIPIHVNYPGVKEKYKWKKDYSKKRFELIIDIFDFINLLSEGLEKNYKIKETVRTDHLKIQLDSAIFSNQHNIFDPSEDEALLLYFTVMNESIDTNFFETLSSLEIFDHNERKYPTSRTIRNLGSSVIPPKSTVSLMQGYNVPRNQKRLTVRFTPSLFSTEYTTFELAMEQ